jgi:hypothetical protein
MKTLLLGFFLLVQITTFAQKGRFFPDVSFDSSYTIVGIAQGFGANVDSLERLWFFLDNPADMKKLQQEWVFKRRVDMVDLVIPVLDIFIINGKRTTGKSGVIVPKSEMITAGDGRWYRFDTAKLAALHAAHPLHYRREAKVFSMFSEYVAYANSVLTDTSLLFFFEPDLRFKGKFDIICNRTSDPNSPFAVENAINEELKVLESKDKFQVQRVVNDSFNVSHADRVKLNVYSSKALYDQYQTKSGQKGDWQPTPILMTLFWRDR